MTPPQRLLDTAGHIAALGADLGPEDGVLLSPEGTRFGQRRRRYRMEALANTDPELHQMMVPFPHVLPSKTGGVLALLDSGADVVVAARAGFEELRGIVEIWSAAPGGRTISIAFRRYASAEIPQDPEERRRRLFTAWAGVGSEVASMRSDRMD